MTIFADLHPETYIPGDRLCVRLQYPLHYLRLQPAPTEVIGTFVSYEEAFDYWCIHWDPPEDRDVLLWGGWIVTVRSLDEA